LVFGAQTASASDEAQINESTLNAGTIKLKKSTLRVAYFEEDGDRIIEGDIQAPVRHKNDVVTKSTGMPWKRMQWKNKTIPYEIDPTLPNQARIFEAIEHYHAFTKIKLVPRTNQKDYVYFKYNGADGGCNSWIGRKGGKQIVRIPDWCGTGSVIHEIGHALGLVHEQSRIDRRKYLNINWSNIEGSQFGNFLPAFFSKRYTRFDFDSIMLYGSYAFAKDPSIPTLTKKDGSVYTANRTALSERDRRTLAKMYNYRN
jgi:hypothetical protein